MKDRAIDNILSDILIELRSLRKQYHTWLNVDELSKYLGLKASTIYQYVNQNRIPYKKIPGSSKLLFSRSKIDQWIENGNHYAETNHKAKLEANRIWDEINEQHR